MGRGKHKPMNKQARKAKYTARFAISDKNKAKHLAKMKQANPNYPNKKANNQGELK